VTSSAWQEAHPAHKTLQMRSSLNSIRSPAAQCARIACRQHRATRRRRLLCVGDRRVCLWFDAAKPTFRTAANERRCGRSDLNSFEIFCPSSPARFVASLLAG
jgi:hypothetical protein